MKERICDVFFAGLFLFAMIGAGVYLPWLVGVAQ